MELKTDNVRVGLVIPTVEGKLSFSKKMETYVKPNNLDGAGSSGDSVTLAKVVTVRFGATAFRSSSPTCAGRQAARAAAAVHILVLTIVVVYRL